MTGHRPAGSPGTKVVLLEFRDEADAYLAQRQQGMADPSGALVVSLDPSLRAWLGQRGVESAGTLDYFASEAHARSLRKSHQILNWLASGFNFEDDLGVSGAYTNALMWYSRYFIHHLLWIAEILSEVESRHSPASISAALGQANGAGSPRLDPWERYLGHMAQSFCSQRAIDFEPINCPQPPLRPSPAKRHAGWLFRIGAKIGGPLHRSSLRRMGRRRPLLALTHGYRMDVMAEETRRLFPDLGWVVIGEGGSSSRGAALARRALHAVTAGFGQGNGSPFMGEAWPQVLQQARPANREAAATLVESLDGLALRVEQDPELFSHRGVPIGTQFAAKIRTGIGPALSRLHGEVQALNETLELLRPRLVITPFGRRAFLAVGDLAQRQQIPGLLISHGTFTPMKNDLEEMSWAFHSYGLLHGSYTHSALQTPQAEEFSKQVSTPANFVRTGPLVWGHSVNREASEKLRPRLLAGQEDCRVVVHAGTPKGRGSRHFHVYESPDEYVAALADLVRAVDQLPDVYLIIKFRPLALSVEELRSLLPQSPRFCISVDERFPDVLGLSDLLVSFSSTTIEEALQNRVPVMLYGGAGRYQHLEALDVTPDAALEPRAVYAVRRADYLPDAFQRILDINGRAPLPEELFRPYVYTKDQVTPFPQLVRDLVRA